MCFFFGLVPGNTFCQVNHDPMMSTPFWAESQQRGSLLEWFFSQTEKHTTTTTYRNVPLPKKNTYFTG